MKNSELKALINLLDDPDKQVYSLVYESLKKEGNEIIPELEKVWEQTPNELIQSRLELIIHDIQFTRTYNEMKQWISQENPNVLDGANIVTRFQYPELNNKQVDVFIDQLYKEIWIEINHQLTAFEKIRIINSILFEKHGFSPNVKNIWHPQNNYTIRVLETKKGNAVSLSIIYIELARRLGLPIYGVDIPNNIVLCYLDNPLITSEFENNVLFYIDVISKGIALGKKEIDDYLNRMGAEPELNNYVACSSKVVIRKQIENLIYCFELRNQRLQAKQLNQLLLLFKNSNT